MKVLGIFFVKASAFLHFTNIKNIELCLMNAYIKWWPIIMRLFI